MARVGENRVDTEKHSERPELPRFVNDPGEEKLEILLRRIEQFLNRT